MLGGGHSTLCVWANRPDFSSLRSLTTQYSRVADCGLAPDGPGVALATLGQVSCALPFGPGRLYPLGFSPQYGP
jgi:hypothetical protein